MAIANFIVEFVYTKWYYKHVWNWREVVLKHERARLSEALRAHRWVGLMVFKGPSQAKRFYDSMLSRV